METSNFSKKIAIGALTVLGSCELVAQGNKSTEESTNQLQIQIGHLRSNISEKSRATLSKTDQFVLNASTAACETRANQCSDQAMDSIMGKASIVSATANDLQEIYLEPLAPWQLPGRTVNSIFSPFEAGYLFQTNACKLQELTCIQRVREDFKLDQ